MESPTPGLWTSWRLVYTVCAFFALVAQLCMSNAPNFTILCMIEQSENQVVLRASLNRSCSYGLEGNDSGSYSRYGSDFPNGEFSWSEKQQWVFLSSYFYGYMVVQPAAGRLADKFGGKVFLLMGLVMQGILFVIIPAMARTSYWLAVATRSLQGLLAGFTVPSIYQLYTVWAHPDERAALMSFAYGGYAVGALLVFPICSFLCQLGWSFVFYILGGISILLGILYNWLVYNTLDAHPWISAKEKNYLKKGKQNNKTVPAIPWKQMFTSSPILVFILTHVFHSYGLIVLNLSLPMFLRDTMYFNLKENGYYSAVIHVGALSSRIIVMFTFAQLIKRLNLGITSFRRRVYIAGNTVTVLACLIITTLTCANRMVVVFLIFLVGMSIDLSFTGAYWESCLDLAPAFAGLLTGIANSMSTLSGIISPLVMSDIITEGSKSEWNYIYYSMAISYFLSMMVYGTFGSSERLEWGQFVKKSANDGGE